MNWDDLRIVRAVHAKGSFAKAAQFLGMDETTVARRLSRLQSSLGVTLFKPVDGVRKVTPSGEAVLRRIGDMEQAAVRIEAIGRESDHPIGEIRLSATASIAEAFLAPDLSALLEANPGVSLVLETANETVDFSNWEADIAIRLGKPARGVFVMRKLADLHYCLIRPKRAGSEDGFICAYPEELDGTPEMAALAKAGLPAPMRFRSGNLSILTTMLRGGSGAGVLPHYLVPEFRADKQFMIEKLDTKREVWMLLQSHLKHDPAARVVADWIVERFGALRGV